MKKVKVFLFELAIIIIAISIIIIVLATAALPVIVSVYTRNYYYLMSLVLSLPAAGVILISVWNFKNNK